MRKNFGSLTVEKVIARLFGNPDNRQRSTRLAAVIALCFVTIVTVLSGLNAAKIQTAYSLTGFLAQGDAALKEDAELKRRFKMGNSAWMMVVAEHKQSWLHPKSIQDLTILTNGLTSIEGVKSVASLGTLETVVRSKNEIRLGRMSDVLDRGGWETLVSSSEIAAPVMVSKDGKWGAVLVEIKDLSAAGVLELRDSIQGKFLSNATVSQTHVGGVAVAQAEMSATLSRELRWLGGVGILAATLALFFLFSGWTGVAIAGAASIAANSLVIGFLAMTGQSLGVLSLSLPIVIAVQTLSLTVHCLYSYLEIRSSKSKDEAVFASFKQLLFPNLLVSLATGVGFLTLATSNVGAMKEFGLTVAFSSVALWIVTTLTVYPLLILAPEPRLRSWAGGDARWMLYIMKYRLPILGLFGLLTIMSLATGMKLNYSHRLFDDLGEKSGTTVAARIVDSKLGGLVPVEIEIGNPSGESWLGKAGRERLSAVVAKLRANPVVGSAISPLDLMKLAGARGNVDREVEEIQTLFELAPQNPMRNYLRDDGRVARISLRLKDVPSDAFEAGLDHVLSEVESNSALATESETGMRIGGWGSYIHRMNRDLSRSLIHGFWEALAAISILLVIVFRSWRWAIIAIIPSVIPPLFLIGLVSFFRIEMKPGLAIVFAIALGFAFINSIYLLKRVKEFSMKSPNGKVTARVVEHAFWREGQSCLLASITLMIGFSSLCFSEFGVARSFGIAMVFSMFAGVLGDLVLLPALIRQFPDFLNQRGTAADRRPEISARGAVTASVAVFALMFPVDSFAASTAASVASDTLEEFARLAGKSLFAKDERVEVEMTNVDADGEKEIRKIELSRLTVKKGNKVEQKILARILAPKSLRGTSVLTVTDGESQNRWIYIPSTKQVRRVVGGDEAGAPILGSELSTEDLNLSQVDGAKARISARKGGTVTVESKIASKESAYSKCTADFDEKSRLMQVARCDDRAGAPFKKITVGGYKKFKGEIARPTEMTIENLKSKRMTHIRFSDQKINSGLKASMFTPEALKD